MIGPGIDDRAVVLCGRPDHQIVDAVAVDIGDDDGPTPAVVGLAARRRHRRCPDRGPRRATTRPCPPAEPGTTVTAPAPATAPLGLAGRTDHELRSPVAVEIGPRHRRDASPPQVTTSSAETGSDEMAGLPTGRAPWRPTRRRNRVRRSGCGGPHRRRRPRHRRPRRRRPRRHRAPGAVGSRRDPSRPSRWSAVARCPTAVGCTHSARRTLVPIWRIQSASGPASSWPA